MTVKEKIEAQLSASTDKAFVRQEFAEAGAYRQVSLALADLVTEGKLIRAGKGVWVRAARRPSPLMGEEGRFRTTPALDVVGTALVVLRKLGAHVEPNSWEQARLRGQSTQIPVIPMVQVSGKRINRKLIVGGEELQYEARKPRG